MISRKYETGDKVGPLNIIFLSRNKNNTKKAIFKCPFCKEPFEAYICNVKTGKTKSCGCATSEMISSKLKKDVTNHRFSHLTALYDTQKIQNGHSVWHCKCDCGNETDVPLSNLESGNTTTCGKTKECIYAKQKASQSALDLVGKRFGKLLVIKELYRKNNKVYWECQCDCGTKHVVRTTKSLQNSNFASCGCEHSVGEAAISHLLDKKHIRYYREVTISGCINPETGYSLRFDFYVPDYDCYIEYNGKQHYVCTNAGWNDKQHFEDTILRDKIKYNFCKQNDIRLEYITYLEDIEDRLEDILL